MVAVLLLYPVVFYPARLTHTVLCCAVLCCAVLCCAVLCCAVLCCAVLCCVVSGKGSEIGDFLTTHPAANCISFTGGDTGIAIARKAGMVPLQMELGGKDACIVCR